MLLLIPPMIDIMKTTKVLMLRIYATFLAMIHRMEVMNDTAIVIRQSVDNSKNDDFFYLPPEAFDNPDFIDGSTNILVARRQVGALFIYPSSRSDDTVRNLACRFGANLRTRGTDTIPLAEAKGLLPRRYCRKLQIHTQRRQIGPDDRGGLGAHDALYDHAATHPTPGGRVGDRSAPWPTQLPHP